MVTRELPVVPRAAPHMMERFASSAGPPTRDNPRTPSAKLLIQGFHHQGLRVRYSRAVASLGRLNTSNPFAHRNLSGGEVCCILYCLAVRSGDVVWNPLTGEKSLLIESAEETSGARIVADFAVEEGGFVPGGEHVHDSCVEHFDVKRGRITFIVDGQQQTLGPGDETTVQQGSWHRWWNSGEEEVRLRVRVEPALRFQEMILIAWGLCADGHTDAEGFPSLLPGALLATRYRAEIRVRKPPQLVQRVMLPPVAALARARGVERLFERYLSLESHPSAETGFGRLPDRVMRKQAN